MDPANLFHAGELPRMKEILDEACTLLGKDIVPCHAMDLDHDGEAGHKPAGHGVLDYDRYMSLLRKYQFKGPILLHGLTVAHRCRAVWPSCARSWPHRSRQQGNGGKFCRRPA
jgi:sugar phosphate isomerase/epimerase